VRLAYLCADRGVPIDGVKGASIHVRAVADALCERGHELTVLAARPGEKAARRSWPLVDVGYDRCLKELQRSLVAAGGDRQLGRETHAMLLNVRASEALEELERKQPLDAVYERYSLWSWAGLRFARRHRKPLILEVNAPLVREAGEWRHLEMAPVARAVERQVLRGADAVIVPSRELADWLIGEVGRRRHTRVIPNGFDERLFRRPAALPAAAGRLRGRYVVVFVGSLKPWHGVDVLLAAFERLLTQVPEAHLLVVGDGPLRRQVEAAGRRLGAGRVSAPGAVDHARVPGWLACADVAVAPYPCLDSFYFSPLKVVEYQAAGLPVVASHCGQLDLLIADGESGRLVPPGDADGLAAALAELAGDPELRRRMGERGRRRAFRNSGWSSVAARTEAVIERCLDRRSAAAPNALAEAGA
jgi:glycosyltransferase involved in cell wall biosynthesis